MGDDALFFIGPDGKTTTLDQPPRQGLERWRPRDKAMVVAAVRYGLITLAEACARYDLSVEEYLGWYRCYAPQPPDGRP